MCLPAWIKITAVPTFAERHPKEASLVSADLDFSSPRTTETVNVSQISSSAREIIYILPMRIIEAFEHVSNFMGG